MPQRKRNSPALIKAERRIEGLQVISFTLDLGNGLSVHNYKERIQDLREKLAAYNQTRSMMDKAQNALVEAERAMNDYSEHMLLGVATRYGKSSDEYEMACGTRKSDRRRSRTVVSSTVTTIEGSPVA